VARGARDRERSVWDEVLPRVARLLPAYLAGRRWFGGKGRSTARVRLLDRASLRGAADALLTVVEVSYADRATEEYFLPLAVAYDGGSGIASPILRHGAITIRDAFEDDRFCRALLTAIARGARVPTARGGRFTFEPRGGPRRPPTDAPMPGVRPVGAEQSNTAVVYDDALILKAFRRLRQGPNPEVEMLDFLARHAHFPNVPPLVGVVEYRAPDGRRSDVGVLEAFIPNEGDGWSWTLRALGALVAGTERGTPGAYLAGVAELGRVTARLHLALASAGDVPAFRPEPITGADLAAWNESISGRLDSALDRLREHLDRQPEPTRSLARDVLAAEGRLRRTIVGLDGLAGGGTVKTRHHGDYHLGQVLKTADSFAILDFEGEPLRPLAERRALHTPLKDVAGMLRSFSYAGHAASRAAGAQPAPQMSDSNARLAAWEDSARRALLDAYLGHARAAGAPFVPTSGDALRRALAVLELDKALYELEYELANRPDWLAIPLSFLSGTWPGTA
jgi:maltose alpha-D-glucosyltransferase/alpha-amylase